MTKNLALPLDDVRYYSQKYLAKLQRKITAISRYGRFFTLSLYQSQNRLDMLSNKKHINNFSDSKFNCS